MNARLLGKFTGVALSWNNMWGHYSRDVAIEEVTRGLRVLVKLFYSRQCFTTLLQKLAQICPLGFYQFHCSAFIGQLARF
jgi:hypothetical protein